jgi:hypothetical protein
MRKHLLTCVLVATLGAGAGEAFADESSAGVPGEWLSRWTGARTVGMGGANVASANEAIGAIWNPAGLSRMDQNEIHFETARLFEETSMNGFSLARPSYRYPSIGLTTLSLGSGDFEKTNDLNERVGTFNEGDMAFLFTVSQSIGRKFALGTNVKVVRQAIDEFDATGWGADLGLLYDFSPRFRLGMSMMNVIGPNLKLRETEESFPMEMRGGFSASFLDGRGLFTTEFSHMDGPGFRMRGGSEYWVHPSMALRIGYDDSAPAGGFSYRVQPDMRFDYGMASHELGVTHRFGISYRFGGFHATSAASPPVFSPLGEQPVTKIGLKAHTKAEAEEWALVITDKQDEVVREYGGPGAPPAHVMWDGKGASGLPLPDGSYIYQLKVIDAEGRVVDGHPQSVEIATGGVRGSVPVLVN